MGRPRNIATIAVRLMALYFIFMNLVIIPSQITAYYSSRSADASVKAYIGSSFINIGISIIIGLILWTFSNRIADMVCKGINNEQDEAQMSLKEIQIVSVSILGLYILSSAIPSLSNIVVSYIFPTHSTKYNYTLGPGGKFSAQIPISDLVGVGIKLGFGAICTVRAKGIVIGLRDLWKKGKGIN